MGINPGCRVLCSTTWLVVHEPVFVRSAAYKTQAIMGEDVIVDPSEQ